MPGSTTFFRAATEEEVVKKPQQNAVGTRQPPPVAPRTTSISLQSWQSATSGGDNNFGDERHARSASMDSLESSGSSSSGSGGTANHRSADLGSGEFIPTRTVGKTPKLPSHNPLQFVKVQSPLYKKAEQQIKLTKEVKITREALKEGEEEWQSNLDNWKSRRRKVSEKVIQRAEEMRQIEAEEQLRQEQLLQQQRKIKKFSEIVEKRSLSRSYNLDLYIGQGDDSGLGGTPEPDDSIEGQNSALRSDTSEGMTSEAESVDSDIHRSDKLLEKEPPKVPQKPWLKKDSIANSYNSSQTSSNEHYEHCLSTKEISISDNISSAEPSDVEGHSADTETASSEEDIAFCAQTGNADSGLESLCDTNRRGDLADSASDLSQDSCSGLEKTSSRLEAFIETDDSDKKLHQEADDQDSERYQQSYKMCIKPGDNRGFGFSLKGGKDQGCPPCIDYVTKDGPADVTGLKNGDKIISVNGELTKDYSHASLVFSIKQAVYTGCLDIVVSRTADNTDSIAEKKSKPTRKGSSFAEKLALFSTGVSSPMPNIDEPKSLMNSTKADESKHESLVLRRRSAFENGRSESCNVLTHRSSYASQGTPNITTENSAEKRRSLDLTSSQAIFQENSVNKKGRPPPVPVKPKLKSKTFVSDLNKTDALKVNDKPEESHSLNPTNITHILDKNAINTNDCENSDNMYRDSICKFSNHDSNLINKNEMNNVSQDSNFTAELSSKDLSNAQNYSDVQSFKEPMENLMENKFPNEVETNLIFDSSKIKNSEKIGIYSTVDDMNDYTESKYMTSENETFPNESVPNMLDSTFSDFNLKENVANFESCDTIATDLNFSEPIPETMDQVKEFMCESNLQLTEYPQVFSECASNWSDNKVESTVEIPIDGTDLDETSACHGMRDAVNSSDSILTVDNADVLEQKSITSAETVDVDLSTADIQTNSSPLCLPLEKIDEDDVISASTTTSSDTPDTETVIETGPSNLSPLPNDESNGEDSSAIQTVQDLEQEPLAETDLAYEMSSNTNVDVNDVTYSENAQMDNEDYNVYDDVPLPEEVIVPDYNNPLPYDAPVLDDVPLTDEDKVPDFNHPVPFNGNSVVCLVARKKIEEPYDSPVLDDVPVPDKALATDDFPVFEDVVAPEILSAAISKASIADAYVYDENQDDEYSRELDESLDQITSLDVIDEIEQKLMQELELDAAVYEAVNEDLNPELDISRQWLFFTEESELLEDLTPRNLEPPREPPPPPPPPDVESSSDSKILPMSRTNSTKRIKKELWRRRSDFLGLDSPEGIDIDNIPPPPPGIEEILKQEREQTQWLEKRLSSAEQEEIVPLYSEETLNPVTEDYKFPDDYNDYNALYLVEEELEPPVIPCADDQNFQWKDTLAEQEFFESAFESPFETILSASKTSAEDSVPKLTESPQHKAKQNIQNLGAAPKAKIMDSTKWITEKVTPVNKKTIEPVFRQSSYNQNYWLAQDGERRRSLQYVDSHVDRRYSMPPSYPNPHPDVTVRTWGDREYEFQQQRPRSAVWSGSSNNAELYEPYIQSKKQDVMRTRSLDGHRDLNCDTNTLESEVHNCSCCGKGLCEGSAMGIEALRLYFHIECFRCCLCQVQLGNGSCGTDVQVKNNQLYCPRCFTVD